MRLVKKGKGRAFLNNIIVCFGVFFSTQASQFLQNMHDVFLIPGSTGNSSTAFFVFIGPNKDGIRSCCCIRKVYRSAILIIVVKFGYYTSYWDTPGLYLIFPQFLTFLVHQRKYTVCLYNDDKWLRLRQLLLYFLYQHWARSYPAALIYGACAYWIGIPYVHWLIDVLGANFSGFNESWPVQDSYRICT